MSATPSAQTFQPWIEVQCASYARDVLGGCAITEQVEGTGDKAVPVRRLHTVLSTGVPQLVELEARCSALADDTITAFGGRQTLVRQMRASTDVVYSALTRVLRAADELAAGEVKDPRRRELIQLASSECAHAERQVNKAIQRQARLTYFQGALAGAVVTVALCAALGAMGARWWSGSVQMSGFVASIVFGALGAVASVSQRISTGKLVLDFTVSRWQMLALGGLRPLVGAVFGAVAHFGLAAGVFGSVANSAEQTAAVGFSAVVGFAAGFSERLATDMIERAGRVATTDVTAPEQQRAAAV
jgi:hypothetical protein